eukprot:CAMPEP_0115042018 /NCGR_PEP_ID=MMETSP0216-20121206/46017_1 /TAXON_ID=223996 /ORGANISM="Protocruzia adherens, Strain Boccale" /LENGTH=225 /DNA_ID=CAMNT_0002424055 /DNA_START=84 /DNA_END=761 /DNA_ORIENTATION=-
MVMTSYRSIGKTSSNPNDMCRRSLDSKSVSFGNRSLKRSKRSNLLSEDPIPEMPYPYFASFVDEVVNKQRKGKRVFCDVPTQSDLGKGHLSQIFHREKCRKGDEEKEKQEGRQEMDQATKKWAQDNRARIKARELMKTEFLTENSKLMASKIVREENEHQSNRSYRPEYFPFIHGEVIEKQQDQIREELNKDLKFHLANQRQLIKNVESEKEKLSSCDGSGILSL